MKTAVFKRSVSLGGRKTSISLEDAFWDGLRDIARQDGLSVAQLIARIDRERVHGNLSSAIRVFVLVHHQKDPAPLAPAQHAATPLPEADRLPA